MSSMSWSDAGGILHFVLLYFAGFHLLLAFLVAMYFVPSIVAYRRERPDFYRIMLVNGLLGWTKRGWLVSLIWAFKGQAKQ